MARSQRRDRRGGRPRRPPEARREVRLGFRVTAAEAESLRAQARARHLGFSRFLARTLLARKLPPLPAPAVDLAVAGQLAAIGNNLNQAVHLLHTGRLDPAFGSSLAELRALVLGLQRRLSGLPPETPQP